MKSLFYSKLIILSLIVFLCISDYSCKKFDPETPVGYNNKIEMVIDSVTNVYFNSARIYARVLDIKNHQIESYGFCWDTNEFPTVYKNVEHCIGTIQVGTPVIKNISEFFVEKTHYIRMFTVSKNINGDSIVAYGDQVRFTTYNGIPIPPDIIFTGIISSITSGSALADGTIHHEIFNPAYVQHGHCWSSDTANYPTLNDSKTMLGSMSQGGNYSYSSNLQGLISGTYYFVRAYGITSHGDTIYGNKVGFSTN